MAPHSIGFISLRLTTFGEPSRMKNIHLTETRESKLLPAITMTLSFHDKLIILPLLSIFLLRCFSFSDIRWLRDDSRGTGSVDRQSLIHSSFDFCLKIIRKERHSIDSQIWAKNGIFE